MTPMQTYILACISIYAMKVKVTQSCPTLCDPRDYTIHWNYPKQNTGVGSRPLLQAIFPTQGLNPSLLHCRQADSSLLSHQGRPCWPVAALNTTSETSLKCRSSFPFPPPLSPLRTELSPRQLPTAQLASIFPLTSFPLLRIIFLN